MKPTTKSSTRNSIGVWPTKESASPVASRITPKATKDQVAMARRDFIDLGCRSVIGHVARGSGCHLTLIGSHWPISVPNRRIVQPGTTGHAAIVGSDHFPGQSSRGHRRSGACSPIRVKVDSGPASFHPQAWSHLAMTEPDR